VGEKYYKKAISINKSEEALNGLNRCKRELRREKNLLKKRESVKFLELTKDYLKIINICNSILKGDPNDEFCLEKKAYCLLKINKKEEAIGYYDLLIDITGNEDALARILELYRKLNIDAAKCCGKLMQINPNNEQANAEKGIYFTNAKKYNEAMNCFAKIKADIDEFEPTFIFTFFFPGLGPFFRLLTFGDLFARSQGSGGHIFFLPHPFTGDHPAPAGDNALNHFLKTGRGQGKGFSFDQFCRFGLSSFLVLFYPKIRVLLFRTLPFIYCISSNKISSYCIFSHIIINYIWSRAAVLLFLYQK